MADGLFGAGATSSPAATAATESRRVKLFPWDSPAMQLLEPYGESAIDNLSMPKLWEAVSKGNQKAKYHSHLCAGNGDQWHIGAGISLTAAALVAAVKHFRSDNIRSLLKPDLYEKIEKELVELEPILNTLNLGKGSQTERDTGSLRQAKRQKTGEAKPDPSEAEVVKAAHWFHAWLSKPQSPFRSFLFIAAAGNTFYTGHVAEVVARAAVAHKPMRTDDFETAMRARLHKPASGSDTRAAASTAAGLFE